MKQINNFNQLIEYFKQPEVEFNHIQQVCNEGLGVIFLNDHDKNEAIIILINYWELWGNNREHPIFIDL